MDVIRGKNLTDVAKIYHGQDRLVAREYLGHWFNVGTSEDLFSAMQYRRQVVIGTSIDKK
jgi:hypothetical protein